MFDSDLEAKGALRTRRMFLASAAATLGGLALWSWKKSRAAEVVVAAGAPKEVTIVQFSDSGERLKTVQVPNSPFYRPDIGDRLKTQLPQIQAKGYATKMIF